MMEAQELQNSSLSCVENKSMAGRPDRNYREDVASRRDSFTDFCRRFRISRGASLARVVIKVTA